MTTTTIDRDTDCRYCGFPRHAHWGTRPIVAGRCPGFKAVEAKPAPPACHDASPMRTALEAAEHWLAEEAASPHPGQTRPDDILRVIRDALGKPQAAPSGAYEAAARAAGWQFEPYTADIATPDYPGYWWRRDDDGPGNDEDETAKRGFACLTADSARIACQQIDGIEPDDAGDAARSAPQAPDASALMLAALRLAAERIEINNCEGEEDEALAEINAAIRAAKGREG